MPPPNTEDRFDAIETRLHRLETQHTQIIRAMTSLDSSLDTLLEEIQGTREIVSLLNQTTEALDRSMVRMDGELKSMKQAIKPLLK